MPKKTDTRPRHQQIAADLRAQIMSGELEPGQRLPTTQQLMDRYDVTGQTVQRTLGVLKAEGFVTGRAGVGVFVRDESPLAITPAAYLPQSRNGESYRWMSQARARSQRGSSRLLFVGESVPPRAIAEALGIAIDEPVIERHQILSLDDEPAELVWNFYPMSIARGTPLERKVKIRGGAPTLLAELGHPPREHTDQVSVRLATTEEFVALELPDDVPVLRTLRVVHSDDARPVEASILVKGGHRYELTYRSPIDH
ncbi:GntR family transcriptional regulator [Nocardiopsis sp. NPDC049922]|uniref:GntR family transcriptional regulator n=1 Tax=Nocardiopsis sp. NPDC049922 TaxID=3155157 RepID=UPI0033DEC4A0